jgi:hypothetical protein
MTLIHVSDRSRASAAQFRFLITTLFWSRNMTPVSRDGKMIVKSRAGLQEALRKLLVLYYKLNTITYCEIPPALARMQHDVVDRTVSSIFWHLAGRNRRGTPKCS